MAGDKTCLCPACDLIISIVKDATFSVLELPCPSVSRLQVLKTRKGKKANLHFLIGSAYFL